MNTVINAAISFAITVAVVAAAMVVIEALKRRGFDPVGRIAATLSPPMADQGPSVQVGA
jgi:hypothetical protein